MKATRLAVSLLALVLVLSACSRRQTEWEAARTADTVESYERFLQAFPDGEFSSQAQARAQELREERDWKEAVAANTLGAYQKFVAQYPDGRMGDEARIRIESFTLAAAGTGLPADAGAPGTTSALPQATPPGATATLPSPPAQSATANGAYRIQLGAFSGGEKQAMGEWRRLQREFPQLLSGLSGSVKLGTTNSGHLYRLQAGATNEARAREICSKLQAQGQACVVVPP